MRSGEQLRNFIERDLVVAANFEFLPHLAEVLRQVVSERIVVVEKQNHFLLTSIRCSLRVFDTKSAETRLLAAASALAAMRDLQRPYQRARFIRRFLIFAHGTESATSPAPA